ncbi:NHLP bacteriocin system secretion protein [Flavobacteriaceae bacterium]|jgi:HlyD family secretion protein|nr:NHLP bacteriocin system secretion protein [Flavobacteriaceae bacterium]
MEKIKNPSIIADNFMTNSIVVTRPIHSYVLIAFIIAALISLAWGIFGSIPQRIEGMGEIGTLSGLERVIPSYGGQIKKVNVKNGDTVHTGDVLFILEKIEIYQGIQDLKLSIRQLEQQKALISNGIYKSTAIKKEANTLAKSRLNKSIDQIDKKIVFYEKKDADDKQLYQKGLITNEQYFSSKSDLAALKNEKISLKEQLTLISLSKEELKFNNVNTENDISNQIEVLKSSLIELEKNYKLQTEVVAYSDGVIGELSARIGDLISPGYSLAVINHEDKDLKNYIFNLYVPYNANEPIEKGMSVDIQPFNVEHNKYGWLQGKVHYVSSIPADDNDMLSTLGIKNVVELIDYRGSTYKVVVILETDPSTFSGFKWSNNKGPQIRMKSGQLGLGYVNVKVKAPIDIVLPIFKKYFF